MLKTAFLRANLRGSIKKDRRNMSKMTQIIML